MFSVKTGEIPETGSLAKYRDHPGCYTDCFFVDVPGDISLSEYISAFFNNFPMRVERSMLTLLASKPSSIEDVQHLALGTNDKLAIWETEEREQNQLLMSVGNGPIRSWWMIAPPSNNEKHTRLFFGSAFLPRSENSSGEPKKGIIFHALLGFHKFYSRLLLWMVKRNLQARVDSSYYEAS